MPKSSPGSRSPCCAQVDQRARGRPLVAGHERVGQRPQPPLGRARARRPATSSTPSCAPSPCSSASFSSSRSSRCWRSPTCATSARAPALSSSTPSSAARAISQRGSSRGLDVALLGDHAAGRLDRLVQRGRAPCGGPPRGRRTPRSAPPGRCPPWPRPRPRCRPSFQRSTPSAITKRRPSAKVIALSAAATASGVQASPSSTSTPPAPLPPRPSPAAAPAARRCGRGRPRGPDRRA